MTENKKTLKNECRLLAIVWQMAKGNHAIILLAMVLQVVISVFPAGITYYVQLFAKGETSLIELFTLKNLTLILGVSFLSIILKQCSSVMQGYAMANTKRNTERQYIKNLSALTYAMVHDKMDNRNVLAVTRESEMLTSLIPMVYRSFIQAPITILAFLALMIIVSFKLTIIIVMLIVVVVICSFLLRKTLKEINRRLFNRYSDLHQLFADWLRGYKVVIFYNALGMMQKNLTSVVDDTCDMSKKLVCVHSLQTIVIELLTYGVVLFFLLIVTEQSVQMKWQAFISFPTAILFIRNEAIKMSRGYIQLASTESAVKRLTEIITLKQEKESSAEWDAPIKDITFNHVSFSYDDKHPILTDASWQIAIDGVHALTGFSGVGKTTCLDLLTNLRKPLAGQIYFNGIDTAQFSCDSLLKRIAYVEQEPFIYEDTLYNNFTMGETIEKGTILEYCRALRMTHIVNHEDDLTRKISGKDFSVGEKQRIAFIRALLKSPDIILLDEMTSNVDIETSTIMLDFIEGIANEKIVICISHDWNVIKRAKHVTRLADGKLYDER